MKGADVAASMWNEDVSELATPTSSTDATHADTDDLRPILTVRGRRLPLTRYEMDILRMGLDLTIVDFAVTAARMNRERLARGLKGSPPRTLRKVARELCDFLLYGEPPQEEERVTRWRQNFLARLDAKKVAEVDE